MPDHAKAAWVARAGGPALALFPDETVTTKETPACAHCQATLCEADHVLHGRYDKIEHARWCALG